MSEEEDEAYFRELAEIVHLAPSDEFLDLMVKLYPPPQSWFDEEYDVPCEDSSVG